MINIRFSVSLILTIIITSCKTLDTISYTKAPNDPIEEKILTLEKKFVDDAKYESDMIDNNICGIYGAKYGYIIYKGNIDKDLKGYAVSTFFGSLLCGLPWLLGVPVFITTCNASVEYEIQNSKKETIAKFSGNGIGRAPCAMYYGYNGKNSSTKAVYDATNMAHKEIRRQLTKEVVIGINEKLKEAGKIE